MIKPAFGAGSVPCKQQHTVSMEIGLARPTTQAGTCLSGLPSRVRCSVFWSPSSPWQCFGDDPQAKTITPGIRWKARPLLYPRYGGASPSMGRRQESQSLKRKVDRPLRRAMLKGKAAKPLTTSSAKSSCLH
jgi:hypothetical protein